MAGQDRRRGGRGRGDGTDRAGGRREGGRPRDDQQGRGAYAFEIDEAEELLALLRDDDGVPDEDLLDAARDRLDRAVSPRQAERHQLLLWMSPEERDEVVALLEEDLHDDAPKADPKVVRHVAHHLERRLSQRTAGR